MNKLKIRKLAIISPFMILPIITLLLANPFTYTSSDATTNLIKQSMMILMLLFGSYKTFLVLNNKYNLTLNKVLSDLGIFLAIYLGYSSFPSLFNPNSAFPIWFNIMYIWPSALGIGMYIYFNNLENTQNKIMKSCIELGTGKLIYKEQSALIVNHRHTYNLSVEFENHINIIQNVSNQIALNIETGHKIKIKYNPNNKKEFILA